MITVGSLFAGIGGFDLGLERAGMKTVWQVEVDEYCQRVLAKHWPDVERYGDVRDCGAHNLERVDLVCGGFPCQPVSHAGKRQGDADERWLWPEFARIVRELEPRWVLAENVPGLLSVDDGRLFGTVLSDLASLGYAVEWECIPAAALGAPHIRDRVWIVAHASSQRRQQDTRGSHGNEGSDEGRPTSQTNQPSGNGQGLRTKTLGNATGHNAGQPRLESHRKQTGPFGPRFRRGLRPEPCRSGQDVAHADAIGRNGWAGVLRPGRGQELANGSQWTTEPDVGRVAHGITARVDRLRALGNAVVPQVVEWIGRRIVEAEH